MSTRWLLFVFCVGCNGITLQQDVESPAPVSLTRISSPLSAPRRASVKRTKPPSTIVSYGKKSDFVPEDKMEISRILNAFSSNGTYNILGEGAWGVVFKGSAPCTNGPIAVKFRKAPVLEKCKSEKDFELQNRWSQNAHKNEVIINDLIWKSIGLDNLERTYPNAVSGIQKVHTIRGESFKDTPVFWSKYVGQPVFSFRRNLPYKFKSKSKNEQMSMILNWTKQLLEILKVFQVAGFQHRDIKADNIVIDFENNQLSVIDYGNMKQSSEQFTDDLVQAGKVMLELASSSSSSLNVTDHQDSLYFNTKGFKKFVKVIEVMVVDKNLDNALKLVTKYTKPSIFTIFLFDIILQTI